jgi:hypothetical protein
VVLEPEVVEAETVDPEAVGHHAHEPAVPIVEYVVVAQVGVGLVDDFVDDVARHGLEQGPLGEVDAPELIVLGDGVELGEDDGEGQRGQLIGPGWWRSAGGGDQCGGLGSSGR